MVTIEQWRAQIGSFSCRGEPEDDSGDRESERLWRLLEKKPPMYSERYRMNCDIIHEEDLVRGANHETVIEDELIKGGIESNPGPGLQEMVSLLNNMRVCSSEYVCVSVQGYVIITHTVIVFYLLEELTNLSQS